MLGRWVPLIFTCNWCTSTFASKSTDWQSTKLVLLLKAWRERWPKRTLIFVIIRKKIMTEKRNTNWRAYALLRWTSFDNNIVAYVHSLTRYNQIFRQLLTNEKVITDYIRRKVAAVLDLSIIISSAQIIAQRVLCEKTTTSRRNNETLCNKHVEDGRFT